MIEVDGIALQINLKSDMSRIPFDLFVGKVAEGN